MFFMIHIRNSIEHRDNSQFQSHGSFRVTESSVFLRFRNSGGLMYYSLYCGPSYPISGDADFFFFFFFLKFGLSIDANDELFP